MKAGRVSDTIWFWGAYCALLGCRLFMLQVERYTPQLLPDHMLTELQHGLAELVRCWAMCRNITAWQDARNVLLSVLWPHSAENSPNETLAEVLWEETIQSSSKGYMQAHSRIASI